jgi:DNA-binding NtrC family response regulator
VIERAVVLAKGPAVRIDRELLPGLAMPGQATSLAGPSAAPANRRAVPPVASAPAPGLNGPLPLETAERLHIEAALARCDWRIEGPRGAAAELAVHPSTLRSRMKKLGLERRAAR